jgi:hypothetical protein
MREEEGIQRKPSHDILRLLRYRLGLQNRSCIFHPYETNVFGPIKNFKKNHPRHYLTPSLADASDGLSSEKYFGSCTGSGLVDVDVESEATTEANPISQVKIQ